MRVDDVLEYFDSLRDMAKAIGISEQAVYQWGAEVPKSRRESVRMAMKLRAVELRKRADITEKASEANYDH